MRLLLIFAGALVAALNSVIAWSQDAPGVMSISPDVAVGYDFGDQPIGASSVSRRIDFSIEDFLSGGISNLTITIAVTSPNGDFVIDDSGCNAIDSMPSSGIPCSVDVTFLPSSAGASIGDLIVSCTYTDIFSLGVLPPPASALVGCRPDTEASPSNFPAYFSGVGVAHNPVTARPIPTSPPIAIGILVILLMLVGSRSAKSRLHRSIRDA